jgi:N-acetyl-1-D-myo-inositol-2-amino-2-deoxy-alpha-D-glucopyranoside deacetylase
VRAHATQIPTTSWLHTLASNVGAEFMGVEYYQLARGERAGDGLEQDLFAGLALAGRSDEAALPV